VYIDLFIFSGCLGEKS